VADERFGLGAAGLDAPVLALADQRWAAALADLGPGTGQSRAHQSWWADDDAGQRGMCLCYACETRIFVRS
jgi:hypothetical protein